MSTQYNGTIKACLQCNSPERHIELGTRTSSGFHINENNEELYNNEDLIKFIIKRNIEVYDEYNRPVSLTDFIKIVFETK